MRQSQLPPRRVLHRQDGSRLARYSGVLWQVGHSMPTLTLAARFNKSGKAKVQPLPVDVAATLRPFLANKDVGTLVWGGSWAKDHRAVEMLRSDLEAAGIPSVVESSDGPLFADFHSLRHTFLTLGGRAGIDL